MLDVFSAAGEKAFNRESREVVEHVSGGQYGDALVGAEIERIAITRETMISARAVTVQAMT